MVIKYIDLKKPFYIMTLISGSRPSGRTVIVLVPAWRGK